MASQAHGPKPKVEHVDDVTIVTLTDDSAAKEDNPIARELAGLGDEVGQGHLLLDFSKKQTIRSVELATLISLHNKRRASGGRLTLAHVNPHIREVFQVTRLNTILDISQEAPSRPAKTG